MSVSLTRAVVVRRGRIGLRTAPKDDETPHVDNTLRPARVSPTTAEPRAIPRAISVWPTRARPDRDAVTHEAVVDGAGGDGTLERILAGHGRDRPSHRSAKAAWPDRARHAQAARELHARSSSSADTAEPSACVASASWSAWAARLFVAKAVIRGASRILISAPLTALRGRASCNEVHGVRRTASRWSD